MVLYFQNRIEIICLSKDEMHGKLKRLQKNRCHQLKNIHMNTAQSEGHWMPMIKKKPPDHGNGGGLLNYQK
jgi:hypothetical protein